MDEQALDDVVHAKPAGDGHGDHRDQLGGVLADDGTSQHDTPVAGVGHELHEATRIVVDQAFADAENGTLVRTLRPAAKASASARPTSAISGSVKMAEAALS